MALNKKVVEQEARANQIHQEVYGNTETTPDPQVTEVQAEPVETAVETAPVMEQTKVVDPNDETWEHRYKVLTGKYSAEVPRLAEEIRELKAELAAMREVKTPEPAELTLKSMTPEAVVEQFGEDFAAAVGAIAERIAAQQGNKVREEFAPQVEQVRKSTAQTQRADFMRELSSLVPDWREIDVDAGFTAFLDEVDPLSGRSRREYFNEADASNNANRISRFFTSFKATKAPAPKPTPSVESRISLESQISPSSSQKSESIPGKRFWTQADIRKFYQDMRRGLVGLDEGKRIESDILAAAREGRMAA
jgi:hypothetical protein